ncbi:o-succinylbenzoate--CoA ligase [Photobacterium sp. OFAV2-7]|uniref:o-succinylbenzoate--CoA ligase n=1 Tax=Photobacterium sp. OFAV2-7 TaxID=2917748 RepID=UPI001EF4D4F8|nr:o-succinylbenzoate--CoA ligase [Photobacterium sp. OFAV2-7]MCG7586908.1 o-succinylbenzoate--CoA ligase [Photobacterium sp. OFAV2-7]
MAEITSYFATWPWQHWATKRPSAAALSFGEQTFSWAEVSVRVDEYAQGLVEQGVKRDQLIAVIAPNSVQVLWLILAAIRVGARYVGLNPRSSQPELDQQLDSLQCDFIWYPAKTKHAFEQYSRAKLLPPQQPRLVPVTWQPTRPATLTLTSGSTGQPKAVVHSAQSQLASAAGLLEWMDYGEQDSWLLSLPLFHISGLAIVWRWLYRGARLVIAEPAQFETALASVTHASLVPTQLQRLLVSQDRSDSPSLVLKQVLLGGAVIPVSLTKQAEAAGINCWCGYGLTEMGSTVTAKRADASSGVGSVLPNREITLKDGEILVRGKTQCIGYYRNKTIFPVADGEWFATKDLGRWSGEELHILGRVDNMFISGGENIQPEMIEKELLAHPGVKQAFVLPVDDSEYGQRPVAIIESETPLDNKLKQELHEYMQERVTTFRRPVEYLDMPDNLGAGGIKVSRKRLAEWLEVQN